jgi:hypothetical protein
VENQVVLIVHSGTLRNEEDFQDLFLKADQISFRYFESVAMAHKVGGIFLKNMPHLKCVIVPDGP